MDLNELQEHVDRRFDRIEDKLDTYIPLTTQATSDMEWVKGYVKFSLVTVIGILGYLLSQFFVLR
jgi:hypothetical protein